MAIFKRGSTGIYWYKFALDGQMIRETTRQTNDKIARTMEANHRSDLAKQAKEHQAARDRLQCDEVKICSECEKLFNASKAIAKEGYKFCGSKCAASWSKARTMPTLAEFLDKRFLPDAETRHKAKPATFIYYRQSSDMLKRSSLASVRLEDLTSEHAQIFASEFRRLSPSGINRGLRTLRRALNLAYQWGLIDKPVRVELAKGEVQRDRVLSREELKRYLSKCEQPWRDCAIILAEEGMRPGEVFALRWEHVRLSTDDETGLIQVIDGKSKASRRILPMMPAVHRVLTARLEAAGGATSGWIFPSGSQVGHLTVDGLSKSQHKKALLESGVAPFPPYTIRHTSLTRLGEASGGNVFTLAGIAGHSSISITQRYVHPQAESIDRVFAKAMKQQESDRKNLLHKKPSARELGMGKMRGVGTKLGTVELLVDRKLGARG